MSTNQQIRSSNSSICEVEESHPFPSTHPTYGRRSCEPDYEHVTTWSLNDDGLSYVASAQLSHEPPVRLSSNNKEKPLFAEDSNNLTAFSNFPRVALARRESSSSSSECASESSGFDSFASPENYIWPKLRPANPTPETQPDSHDSFYESIREEQRLGPDSVNESHEPNTPRKLDADKK